MERSQDFTHFQPDQTLISTDEKGVPPPDGTEFVIDRKGDVAVVGSRADVESWVSGKKLEGASVTKEKGGIVLPGLTDTHYHPGIRGAMELVHSVDASQTTKLEQLKAQVSGALRDRSGRKHNEPLAVLDYDSSLLGPMSAINFDEVETNHPVFFY